MQWCKLELFITTKTTPCSSISFKTGFYQLRRRRVVMGSFECYDFLEIKQQSRKHLIRFCWYFWFMIQCNNIVRVATERQCFPLFSWAQLGRFSCVYFQPRHPSNHWTASSGNEKKSENRKRWFMCLQLTCNSVVWFSRSLKLSYDWNLNKPSTYYFLPK